MRNVLVVVFGVCLSVMCMQSALALPAPEDAEGVDPMFGYQGEEVVVPEGMGEQEPRLTCELPGALGTAACTAHCKLKGYSSGWCDAKKVCNCRK